MAIIDTRLSLSAPTEINVSLVRADYLATSGIFRSMFDIFLAISSALIGATLSSSVSTLHWIFLGVTSLSSIVFLGLSVWFGRRARIGK